MVKLVNGLDPRSELLRIASLPETKLSPEEVQDLVKLCDLSQLVQSQSVSRLCDLLFAKTRATQLALRHSTSDYIFRYANQKITQQCRKLAVRYKRTHETLRCWIKRVEDIAHSINRQIKARVTTAFFELFCLPSEVDESPPVWVLRHLESTHEFLSSEDRQTVRAFCQSIMLELSFLDWADLDPWINSMYEVLKHMALLHASLEYWFCQLELCVFMVQLLRARLKRDPEASVQAIVKHIWSPTNLSRLYPQLRFWHSRTIPKLYEWMGHLFDNVIFAETKPVHVDRVVQLLLKGMAQKHQLHHFKSSIAKWLDPKEGDHHNPVRAFLVEIMTFFQLGAYPWCSRSRRCLRRDWLVRMYADRNKARGERAIRFFDSQVGLYALKEFIDWGWAPVREWIARANPDWLAYSIQIRRLCELWRRRPTKALAPMDSFRTKMSAIGAALRIPTDFFRYYFTCLEGDQYNPFTKAQSRVSRFVIEVCQNPLLLLSQETLGWLVSDPKNSNTKDSRRADHALCLRWIQLCTELLKVPTKTRKRLETVMDTFFFGKMGSSRFPAYARTELYRKKDRYFASAMSYLWMQLFLIKSVPWPRNFTQNSIKAMEFRTRLLQGLPSDCPRLYLAVYCTSCHTMHTMVNRPPTIGSAPPDLYKAHRDGGFSSELACNLRTMLPQCIRKGSNLSISCRCSPCKAVSLKGRLVLFPSIAMFLCCHPQCGMPTLLSAEFTRYSQYGPLCSRHSLDPRILASVNNELVAIKSTATMASAVGVKKAKARPPTARRTPLVKEGI